MAITAKQLEKMVASPSVGAVTYQACALLRGLERINHEEYLPQACRIRDVFFCIVDYVLEETWDLQKACEASSSPPETMLARVRALGTVLHEIHSYVRYLWASSPQHSPPGIQVALTQLTEMYFPKANGDPISLVRPQWKYNLTYVPMSWRLADLLRPSVLDPSAKLGALQPRDLLRKLWERNPERTQGEQAPSQLAILSFAGLDTHDTLLYPLLAHELGHFIDFSYTPPLNLRDDLKRKAEIRADQVSDFLERLLGKEPDPQLVNSQLNTLVQQVFVAIREIIADLLATRMLGFGFFVAQAEFLKTLAPWPQPLVTSSGYPGIRFRLQVIFEHLVERLPKNCLAFFKEHEGSDPEVAAPLVHFLELWRERLSLAANVSPAPGSGLASLIEEAVRAVIPDLHELASRMMKKKLG